MCPSLQPRHSQGTGDLWKQELLEHIPGVSTFCANLVLTLALAWSCGFQTRIAGAGGQAGEVVGSWFGDGQGSSKVLGLYPSVLLEEPD